MRNALVLRADSVAADAWRWLQLDAEGLPQGSVHAGPLAGAAEVATGLRVVVLVTGADCLLTKVRIPGRNQQKLLRAVPFALEEQLSDNVEDLHFALGDQLEDDHWSVAVISRSYMETLMATLMEAGLDVQQVIPEILAIPFNEGDHSVLVSGEIALVRTGAASGYAVDSDNLGMVLAAQPQEDGEPQPVIHMYIYQDSPTPDTTGYQGRINVESFAADPLGIFAQGLNTKSVNFLQGGFSRSGEWRRLLMPWRATAALLLVAVLVGAVVTGLDYYHLSAESEQLQARIEKIFKRAMPDTQRVVNPRVQMQQEIDRLQGRSGGGGFLLLLGKTGAVLKDVPGAEIGGLTFRGGRLDLDLKVTDLQLLDTIKQSLGDAGDLDVEIQSATTGKDKRVQSRLRIQGAGT